MCVISHQKSVTWNDTSAYKFTPLMQLITEIQINNLVLMKVPFQVDKVMQIFYN